MVAIATGPSRQAHAKANFLLNRANNYTAFGVCQEQVIPAQ